jgi:hypothetical protein
VKRAFLATLLIASAYVGSYFAVLSLPSSVRFRPPQVISDGSTIFIDATFVSLNGERMADFHGVPSAFFAPIHTLDKQYLRHDHWFTPRNQELSFDWLLGTAPLPNNLK